MVAWETDVLEALDPAILKDTEQWPQFTLKNVKVFSQITGKSISLLAAHELNSLRVEGMLDEVDRDYSDLGK